MNDTDDTLAMIQQINKGQLRWMQRLHGPFGWLFWTGFPFLAGLLTGCVSTLMLIGLWT